MRNCCCQIYNLGTGKGYSVLEMVAAFEKASGKKVPYKLVERRPGDVATCYCDPSLAEKELGWKCQKNLEDMCTFLLYPVKIFQPKRSKFFGYYCLPTMDFDGVNSLFVFVSS